MTAPDKSQTVTIRYFAWLREKTGISEETVAYPEDVGTVRELAAWLRTRGAHFEAAFARPEAIRAAIDHKHVPADTSIAQAREIAFFPPVTGG